MNVKCTGDCKCSGADAPLVPRDWQGITTVASDHRKHFRMALGADTTAQWTQSKNIAT